MDDHKTSTGAFKTIQVIYSALMLGILTFSVVVFAFAETRSYTVDTSDVFFIAVPVVAFSGIYLSKILFNRILNKLKSSDTLASKLMIYQTATLIRAACLEGPAFLAVAVGFTSSNMFFIVIALILVAVMYLTFPTKEKFKTTAALSLKEKTELDKL